MGQNGSSERRSGGDGRPYPYDPPPGNNPELFLLEQEHKRERTGSFGSSRKKDRYVINKQEKFTLGRQRPSSESEGWLSPKDSEKLKKLGNNNNSSGGKSAAKKQDKNKDTYDLSPLGKSPRQGKRGENVESSPKPGSTEASKGNKKTDSKSDGSGKGKKEKGRSKSFTNRDRENQEKEIALLRSGSVRDNNGYTSNVNNATTSEKRDNNNANVSNDKYQHLLRPNKGRQVQVVSDLPEKDINERNVLSKQDHEKERQALRKLESYKKRKAALVQGAQQQNAPNVNQRPSSVQNVQNAPIAYPRPASVQNVQNAPNVNQRPVSVQNVQNVNQRPASVQNVQNVNQRPVSVQNVQNVPSTNQRPVSVQNVQNAPTANQRPASVQNAPIAYQRPASVQNVQNAPHANQRPGSVQSNTSQRETILTHGGSSNQIQRVENLHNHPPHNGHQRVHSYPSPRVNNVQVVIKDRTSTPPAAPAAADPNKPKDETPLGTLPAVDQGYSWRSGIPRPVRVVKSSTAVPDHPPGPQTSPPQPPPPATQTIDITPTPPQGNKQWGKPAQKKARPSSQPVRPSPQAVRAVNKEPTHAHQGQQYHPVQIKDSQQQLRTQTQGSLKKKNLTEYTEIQARAVPAAPSPRAAMAAVAAKGSPFGTSSTRSTPGISPTPLTTAISSSTPTLTTSTSAAVPSPQAKKTVTDLYAFVPVNTTSLIDQNRNKTSKSTSASSSLKRSSSHQPDVVTNSVVAPPSGAAEEISRLEALCETRTKQLNIARMQLRASAQGFDAMSVLVRYLNEELDAFSCPEVTAKLKAVKVQLAEAQQQIDVLAKDKATLEKSLSDLKEQHAAEVAKVKEEHHEELQQLQERLHAEKDHEIEKVVEKYSLEVTTLKSFLEKNITDMKSKHEKTLKDHDQKHSEDVEQLKKDHDSRAKDLQKQHERRMEEITRTFENIKLTLSEKVETLRGECEEMRNREAHLEERTQREADMKIHMALAKYQHLPAEIESLKAVMEMRNQELHELRHKKLDLEKQMEEIPKAREKIISLQQKVENLEAVIQIKADYEKQLAEKHQILLRKFDKESKANKRLSMDNEELAWRLQNSADSPDLLRRSVSHSPTRASAEPTPEVVRRRRSPACSIPTSPRNQTEFDRSPVMLHSPPKSNLKRSGTYDLLHKDLEEKEMMKQTDV